MPVVPGCLGGRSRRRTHGAPGAYVCSPEPAEGGTPNPCPRLRPRTGLASGRPVPVVRHGRRGPRSCGVPRVGHGAVVVVVVRGQDSQQFGVGADLGSVLPRDPVGKTVWAGCRRTRREPSCVHVRGGSAHLPLVRHLVHVDAQQLPDMERDAYRGGDRRGRHDERVTRAGFLARHAPQQAVRRRCRRRCPSRWCAPWLRRSAAPRRVRPPDRSTGPRRLRTRRRGNHATRKTSGNWQTHRRQERPARSVSARYGPRPACVGRPSATRARRLRLRLRLRARCSRIRRLRRAVGCPGRPGWCARSGESRRRGGHPAVVRRVFGRRAR